MHRDESSLAKEIYINVFKATWNTEITNLKKTLYKKEALNIKKWRAGDEFNPGESWRNIATNYVNLYPEKALALNIVKDNQICGIQLCDAAMLKLKETDKDGWY